MRWPKRIVVVNRAYWIDSGWRGRLEVESLNNAHLFVPPDGTGGRVYVTPSPRHRLRVRRRSREDDRRGTGIDSGRIRGPREVHKRVARGDGHGSAESTRDCILTAMMNADESWSETVPELKSDVADRDNRISQLEAKLARAVEALNKIAELPPWSDNEGQTTDPVWVDLAKRALADLAKVQSDGSFGAKKR